MASLPRNIQSQMRQIVFKEADDYGYMQCGRIESGKFIDTLVDNPEIGGMLRNYMPKEKVRTYIKDAILNSYTKRATKLALESSSPEKTICDVYHEMANIIQRGNGKRKELFVLRSESGTIYIVSGGTVLKWETALRKALELIANEPGLVLNGQTPSICLKLSLEGQALTEADKQHIETALCAVGISAVFCSK